MAAQPIAPQHPPFHEFLKAYSLTCFMYIIPNAISGTWQVVLMQAVVTEFRINSIMLPYVQWRDLIIISYYLIFKVFTD